jgi:AraC-like DNA-binding protein
MMLNKLINLIEEHGHLPLVLATSGSSYMSVPAPFLEITLMLEGGTDYLRLGDMEVAFPPQTAAIHNIHFGAMSKPDKTFKGICTFLDLEDYPEFDFIREKPLFSAISVNNPLQLSEAFRRLIHAGQTTGWFPVGYPPPKGYKSNRRKLSRSGEILLKAAVLEVMALLLANASGDTANSHRPEVIEIALSLMQLHHTNPNLTLNWLADQVHLHPDHLGRVFKKHEKISPMKALQNIRITQSCHLLECTNYRIGEICTAVGYGDVFHFSRTFKAQKGLSPKAYREKIRKA